MPVSTSQAPEQDKTLNWRSDDYEMDVTGHSNSRIYDMYWQDFVTSQYSCRFSQREKHDEIVKSVRAYVCEDAIFAYRQIHETTKLKKELIAANALKFGVCIWEHEFHKIFKQTKKLSSSLYDTNYPAYKKIFGRNDGRTEKAEQIGRIDQNVLGDVNETLSVISEYKDYMKVSASLVTGTFMEIGYLRWDGLAKEARIEMERDVSQLKATMNHIANAITETYNLP
jgi:hypothetical protein